MLGRGQCVVGEGRDGCGRGPQRIPDDLVVAAGAQQDPDRRGMPVRSAQLVVDHRDVEPERPDVVVPELADLELDDDLAELLDVEQQQVDEEFIPGAPWFAGPGWNHARIHGTTFNAWHRHRPQ